MMTQRVSDKIHLKVMYKNLKESIQRIEYLKGNTEYNLKNDSYFQQQPTNLEQELLQTKTQLLTWLIAQPDTIPDTAKEKCKKSMKFNFNLSEESKEIIEMWYKILDGQIIEVLPPTDHEVTNQDIQSLLGSMFEYQKESDGINKMNEE